MRSSSSPASPSVMKSLLLGSMVLNILVLFYWFFSAASSAYGAGSGEKDATNYSLCHQTLAGRGDLPAYLNELGLVGQAVEIGVRRGHFSSHMLKNWKGKTLVGIGGEMRCVVCLVPYI